MRTVNASIEVSVEVEPDGGVHFPGRDGSLPNTGLDTAPAALLAMTLILLAVVVTALRHRMERPREQA